ncbi:non-ribosomal peptide synthetase, partial [Nocardia farcinica]|uniref:non-ribosomal peptide synthetase n=1 Tax=Nocardia farcinica TaxID=37329 RepID=UPI002458BA41
ELPADRPRPEVASNAGALHHFTVDAQLHRALEDVARAHGVTLFMVVHAALATWAARLSNSTDIAIGTPIAGRGERALDDLVGMFVNTLVLRNEIDLGAKFSDLLEQVRRTDLAAFAHADVPFERLVDVLSPARSQAHHPLFQVGLTFEAASATEAGTVSLPGLDLDIVDFDAGTAKFDVQLTVGEAAGGALAMSWNYATELFDPETVAAFADRLVRILRSVAEDPAVVVGDIDLLGEPERLDVAQRWVSAGADGGAARFADATLVSLFDEMAAAHPEQVAAKFGADALTYAELDRRANVLARRLIEDGAGPEKLVAVLLPRSLDLVVALLAVVKTGAGYVPIDPAYPAERIAYVLADARPAGVVLDSTVEAEIPAGLPVITVDGFGVETGDMADADDAPITDADRLAPLSPDNVAYVIYTSGSTGRPKGVAVAHRNVVRLLANTDRDFGFGPQDVWTLFHSYAFDFSVWELWGPLSFGGTVVVVDYYTSRSPEQFLELLRAERVTVLNQTPSAFYQLAEADRTAAPGAAPLSLRYVVFGGEALELRRLSDWVARHGDASPVLVNMYGITETTVHVSYRALDAATIASASGSIVGRAIAGLRVYVLDNRLRPVPVGVAGEMYVAGPQLARGYLGRPDLTAARFVANPLGEAGERLYRSGDLARWNRLGELEYLGRADDQVKVRGFRIELGEIEAAVLAQPGIAQAAVIVREDQPGDQRIVAYVVAEPGVTPDLDAVRSGAAEQLPSYMVPSALVRLEWIPLTVNGKLDRRALPAPAVQAKAFRAPVTPVQETVAAVFAEVLDVPRVGVDDDFFELGGNSLIATRVAARIGAALGTTVPVRTLFEASTVEALAARVESHTGGPAVARLAARPRAAGELVPLSYAQQRMWFLNKYDTSSAAYNLPIAIRLTGALDVPALRLALADVVRRHESLRTRYPEHGGTPVQVVVPAEQIEIDLRPVAVAADELLETVTEFVGTGFDVAEEVPLRTRLYAVSGADEHVLVVVVHHIAADGFSMGPLTRDVMTAYGARTQGAVPGWAPLPVQYADFALWQREVLGAEDDPESLLARQVAYWQRALAGVPDELTLPTDRPRPAVASHRGATLSAELPAELIRALDDVARRHGASLFMVMHGALAVLLARLSGSDDITVGTPIAGRGEAALDELVGMFVNTLVLRTGIDEAEPFTALLDRVRRTDLDAYGNADVPFERLVELLAPERSQARNPLFQVMLAFQNLDRTTLELPGLSVQALDLEENVARFDLQFTLSENAAAGMTLALTYATELFDAATADEIVRRWQRVLAAIAADPALPVGAIDVLEPAEQADLVARTGAPAVPPRTLPELLAEAAARDPQAPAVVFEGTSLSYAELDERSNRLARLLIAEGIGAEDLVAVGVPRSADSVFAAWAVAKTGAAFVPVDPNYPAERIAHMVTDSGSPVGLTVAAVLDGLPDSTRWLVLEELDLDAFDGGPITEAERVRPTRPEQPAYVIYTSGSTGVPKGVGVTHRDAVQLFANTQPLFGFDESDVWTLFHSYAFDFSVWELWCALAYGGSVVVVDYLTSRSPELFRELLVRERVTVLNQTPSAFYQLVEADRAASAAADAGEFALRYIVFGGEALDLRQLRRWYERHPADAPRLVNMYGITETTVHVSFLSLDEQVVDNPASVIGRALPGLSAYVLDERLAPAPVGVAGEIYVTGEQLARGYLGRPGLTASRFVANPFGAPGSRMYRSGDVGRWVGFGGAANLEYAGRSDQQVQLRGFRIELGEIEAALEQCDGVRQAVVMVRADEHAGDRLVGYVVPDTGAAVDPVAVREQVAQFLTAYMVPDAIVVLDTLPLTPNGKLDRRALPEPEFVSTATFRAPSTPIEQAVARVFAELLGVDEVGLDDDFFALGGNSLLATRVVARINEAVDAGLAVRELFEAPTVAALAARTADQVGTGRRRALVAGPRPERIPLSLAQQRMWFLNRFDSATAVNNIPLAVRMVGELDIEALRQAVADVIDRHEVLRTTYPSSPEGPHQVILPVVRPRLEPVDIDESELVQRVIAFSMTTFDVTTEVPLAVTLFRIRPDEHVVAFVVHHVAADGSSMGPLARDLMAAYVARVAGEAPQWTPLPVQYADYALWQREVLGSEDDPDSVAARQVAYWKSALAGLPDQLDLPSDRPRPPAQSFHGKAVRFDITPELHARLHELARANNASLFMVVHTALAVLLARLSGTDDIAVGTPIAGRGERELDDLIGMFVNTLVFRTQVEPGDRFADLLAEVRERDLEAFANADVPFERLVEVLNPVRSTARNPLFQVGLSFQNLAETTLALPGLQVSAVDVGAQLAKTDLTVTLYDLYDEDGTPAEIVTDFSYATDLFDEATVQGFADRFVRVLETVVADMDVPVGEIDLLAPEEAERILRSWNDTAHPVYPAATLVSLFDAALAAADPAAVAVVADTAQGRVELTFAELDARVNRLARHLIARGVRTEDRVALAMRRSLDLVVSMYAVSRAGAAYVPIDPDQPAERVGYILETAAPAVVLTTTADAFETEVGEIVAVDALDLSAVSAAPITDADRNGALLPATTAYVIFTSGSTGRPKGVAVPHGAVANQLCYIAEEFALGADDVVLLKTAATFDVSVWEFWSAVLTGGRLVVATADGHRDPAYLNALMRDTGVTTLYVVPSMLDALLIESGDRMPESLRRILAIGEALPAATAQRFRAANHAGLFNLYGPTEAAVSITTHEVDDDDTVAVSIGVPQWNSQVYVLDSRLRPVPVGVSGELYLAGAQLARGYFSRPDLTADRFVANPFAVGERMYRTGDLVAWTADGELDYRGRTDFQVKIRGFRIELGEIESALLKQDAVAAAAVLAHTDPNLGDRLVAYVVPATPGEIDTFALQTALSAEIPSYMVPSVFMQLDELPLNVNGKLDRKALPEPTFEKAVFRAPTTPIEQIVATTFAEVLGLDQSAGGARIGLDDDFFAWGGNSLLATQVASRLGAALNTRVPVRLLFEAPTVAALAVRVEQQAGTGRLALTARPRPERIPLSLAQQRMWFLNRFDTQSAAYNVPMAVRLTGELDVTALRTAIADLIGRHEVLRTVYPAVDGDPVQLILSPAQAQVPLATRAIAAAEIENAVVELVGQPFDVTDQVPVRVTLFEITDAGEVPEYVIAMVVHHIAGDGSSFAPLVRDLMTAYVARSMGEAPNWSPLPVQYADYSIWQRELLGSEDDPTSLMAGQLAYWKTALADLPEQLDLPADRPRPATQSFRGGAVPVRIDAETHRKLIAVGQAESATLFMVVHTALAVLLSRLSGADDIAIGTPIAGRGEAALNDLIGTFINTLVFRSRVAPGEPFDVLLARQREIDIQAFAHADVPFERLVEVLNPARSTARHPLFQVGLSFQNQTQTALELPGLTVSGVDFDTRMSQFDLHLILTDQYDEQGAPIGVAGVLTYAADLFDRATAEGFAQRFLRLLDAVIAAPDTAVGDLELLDAAERRELVAGRNDTAHPLAPALLLDGYRRAVAAHADAVALSYEGAELTYREFDERVNRLARLLIARGVGAESLVGLAVRRSLDLVVGMYAIVTAGGAYVPLDPDHPAERIAHILDTAQPACVLSTTADAVPVPAGTDLVLLDTVDLAGYSAAPVEAAELVRPVRRDNPAYVIFTSGSTGRPKGVAVSHGAIDNQI